jgi:hypothetical protein
MQRFAGKYRTFVEAKLEASKPYMAFVGLPCTIFVYSLFQDSEAVAACKEVWQNHHCVIENADADLPNRPAPSQLYGYTITSTATAFNSEDMLAR